MKIDPIIKTVFAVVFAYPGLNAQTYIPTIVEGNQWEVRMPLGLGQYLAYTYALRCDTVINGLTYLIAKDAEDNVLAFYRENTETQEVYILEADSTEEHLILSYNWQQGDTIELLNSELIVDSVYYSSVYGTERKILWFNGLTQFIEGVGSSWEGIYVDPSFVMDPFRYFHLYDFITTEDACESSTDVHDLEAEEMPIVWPNPFHDRLYITIPNNGVEMCTIYHPSGKIMSAMLADGTLVADTQSFPPGIYVIKIAKGGVVKVVKQ